MKSFRGMVAALLALALPAGAQIIAKKITFAGAPQSQAELLAYSGLAPHKPLSHADVDAAAQKLLDTGFFTNIQYKYDGTELLFAMEPETALLPVHYANFPWWDEPALNDAVAAQVPLFHGALPAESSLQQAVSNALEALLAEKGVRATVTTAPTQDSDGKNTGVLCHIDAPPVQIGAVTLSGASAAWMEPVAAIAKAAGGQNYDGASQATLLTALTAIYHRQGYLEMQLTGFTHGEPQVADGSVRVPLSASVVEGAQYKVASLSFAGGGLVTQEAFAKDAKLHPGDLANEDLLHETLALVSAPYKQHGYLQAKIDAEPRFDAANHTVAYAIAVEPGPQFSMGELSLINLDDDQKAEVLKYWPLHEGDPYDATVSTSFLLKNKATLHSLDGWSATWKAYAHEDTHIVDLVVTFRQGGVLN
jgi:outer membrane protein assembly factor BamA